MKQWICCFSLTLCLCLAGCGVAEDGDAEAAAEPETVPARTDYVTTLSFWFAANGTGESVMREILDDFNASHGDYYVEGTVFSGYEELNNAVMASFTTG